MDTEDFKNFSFCMKYFLSFLFAIGILFGLGWGGEVGATEVYCYRLEDCGKPVHSDEICYENEDHCNEIAIPLSAEYLCRSALCYSSDTGQISGECGSAEGGTFSSPPPTNQLCDDGKPDGAPEESGGKWYWLCKGLNGGKDSPICKATVGDPQQGGGTVPPNPTPTPTPTNQCTQNDGQCISGAACPGGEKPLLKECPGSTTQVCCPVLTIPITGGSVGGGMIAFPNPLDYDTVEQVVGALLVALQGIIVLLSVVFIVIGAVMYITSAGNEGMIKLAKGAILASMIGLAIGIAAPSFLKEIYDILGGGTTMPSEVSSAPSIVSILTNTLNFLLAIVGVLAIIMLVIGGIMYLLAGGDQKRIDAGKNIVIFSIIGLTVALAALIIVRQIANFFG
jgi:hypothetical protein